MPLSLNQKVLCYRARSIYSSDIVAWTGSLPISTPSHEWKVLSGHHVARLLRLVGSARACVLHDLRGQHQVWVCL